MYKYASFIEYIQLNYLEFFKSKLQAFIKTNELVIYDESLQFRHTYENFEIRSIKVIGIDYKKNKRDKVDFDVFLEAEYILFDRFFDENSLVPPLFERNEYFKCRMVGSFKKGFNGKENLSKFEEEPDEKLTQSLVPIISLNDLDDYATKFLKEFCPEALEKPTRLNVNKILNDKGIKVYYAPLPDNIFGKTYFAKDKAVIYIPNEKYDFMFCKTKEIDVEPGTIIINFDKALELPSGAYRNTIIHEAVHWYFHSNYFELRQLLNNELTCAVCCKGESEYENTEIAWMEWQARAIAPRVLMPKKMALLKWKNILEDLKNEKENDYTKFDIMEKALKRFAEFFDVSLTSARIRLSELGQISIDGIKNYVDGSYVEPYIFKKSALKRNQTFTISSAQLRNLLISNTFIQDALKSEKILYINKMLVINHPKFVDNKNYKMTDYALEHADECCLIFNVERYGISSEGGLSKKYYLLSTTSSRREEKSVDPSQINKIFNLALEGASHFESHKDKLPKDFPSLLEYHFQRAKKRKIVNSYIDLEFESDINEKTIRSYKDGKTKPSRINVIKLGLALRLSSPYIVDMLEKADCKMTLNNGDNVILWTIIYSCHRMGLEATYKELEKEGKGYLLEISDNFKDNHGL